MGVPWKLIAIGVGVLALVAAVWAHFSGDAATEAKLDQLTREAGAVLFATRQASDNAELKWDETAGQITALGESRKELKFSLDEQSRRVDEMAAEAVRLRAEAAELKRIADKAETQRRGALRKLSDMAATPGDRANCLALLKEAETALDLIREAGL